MKKKVIGISAMMLVLIMAVAMTMSTVFAATITVTQDGTYDGTAGGAGRKYSYYKVFSASYETGAEFEGGYSSDGTAVTSQGEEKIAYTATPAVAAKLGTIDDTTKAWTTKTDNKWFDLTYIPGTENYTVTWRTGVTVDAATLQAAAAWLKANAAYESGPTDLTFADGKWTSGDVDPGYYIISGDTGDNLAAVTTDIDIKEKNAYPPLTKEQADEDDATMTTDKKSVAVGDVLDYEVTVTIPETAKVGDIIEVYDKATDGLTYNNDINVKTNTGNATVAAMPAGEGEAWRQKITVTESSIGKDVVFAFSMTVNSGALTDTGRKNEAGLKYGNEYDSLPKEVEYETYFAGITKADGGNHDKKLKGVEFTLKENDTEFKVKKGEDGVYIPDATGLATVVTDENGLIRIRGLDKDKKYTLTETKNPNAGYNMLTEPVELILFKDEKGLFDSATSDEFFWVDNYQGTVLPSTGGMGTTIFYIIGAALVVGAGIVLIVRVKTRK